MTNFGYCLTTMRDSVVAFFSLKTLSWLDLTETVIVFNIIYTITVGCTGSLRFCFSAVLSKFTLIQPLHLTFIQVVNVPT